MISISALCLRLFLLRLCLFLYSYTGIQTVSRLQVLFFLWIYISKCEYVPLKKCKSSYPITNYHVHQYFVCFINNPFLFALKYITIVSFLILSDHQVKCHSFCSLCAWDRLGGSEGGILQGQPSLQQARWDTLLFTSIYFMQLLNKFQRFFKHDLPFLFIFRCKIHLTTTFLP